MSVLDRITLRVSNQVDELVATHPPGALREIEVRRLVRAAIQEAVYTVEPATLLSLLEDRAVFWCVAVEHEEAA